MKKVITGEKLYELEEEAITLLCDTVKETLGPRGSNAIIDHSLLSPYITNDGVTIARNIESEDECINTILTLAKSSAIKTDEMVGDGTTTTLVLLESIFKNGLAKIKEGASPHKLKQELDHALKKVTAQIQEGSRLPKEEDYYSIASIAANDERIGKEITPMYLKLQNDDSLKIEEGSTTKTISKIIPGYHFETILASPYFLSNSSIINYKNCFLLIALKEIGNIEEISAVLNEAISKKNPLMILANDYSEDVINEILSMNFDEITNVTLLKIPEYGTHQINLLKDLEVLTESKIAYEQEKIDLNNIGKCEEIKIDKEQTIISNKVNLRIKDYINKLKEQMKETEEEYEQDFLKNRIAKLTNGIGFIYVGATTKVEAKEKKMRYDDALCALKSTKKGIVPGCGLTLLKIKEKMTENTNGDLIIKEALDKPFMQILINVGAKKEIYETIKENNFNMIYNALEDKLEPVQNTKIIDPTSVVITALENAVSIASMLLTTKSLIINEQTENKLNIEREF